MKVLIFIDKKKLAPTGGPIGYCYNIKKYLEENDCSVDIHFLNEEDCESTQKKTRIKTFLSNFLNRHARWLLNYRLYSNVIFKGKNSTPITNINSYDFIHFHTPFDFFREREIIKGYKGKTILTSHSPIPSHMELLEDVISKREQKVFKKLYSNLYQIDEYSFLHADYVFFPCQEAEESYCNKWLRYSEISNLIKGKKRYLLTGTNNCSYRIDPNTIRDNLGISTNSFVISYVGRHNAAKGYDRLKEMGENLLLDKNVFFVICGLEKPMTRLINDNWIEIGWTRDAHSYINASDVFVLPNRDTYFDLVFLEVLSLGKIIVASKTGGNKVFIGESRGIFLYESIEEAIEILKKIRTLSETEKKELETENKRLFIEKYSTSVFMKNYTNLLLELKHNNEH